MSEKENKKLTSEELANKLEEKAKKLRESNLTPEELEKISGGWCHSDGSCCGSSCCVNSSHGKFVTCSQITDLEGEAEYDCYHACIESSPN